LANLVQYLQMVTEALYCPYNLLRECSDCPGSLAINDKLTDVFGKGWPGKVYEGRGVSPESREIEQRAKEAIGEFGLICGLEE